LKKITALLSSVLLLLSLSPSALSQDLGGSLPKVPGSEEDRQSGIEDQRPMHESKGEDISLFFDDADIFEVTHTVFGEILKVNYLIDPRVRGRITFRSVKPIKRKDLLSVISTLFRLNGVSIVEEGEIYRIIPLTGISREPVEIEYGRGSEKLRVSGRSLIQIVPLNFVSASDMKVILTPFLTEGAAITEVPEKNFLVISDTDENMRRLLQIVESFDDELFADIKVELFMFENLNVRDVIDDLRGAFPLLLTEEKDALKVRLIPIERMNSLLVVAPSERYIEHIRKWVDMIDTIFEGAKAKIYVYPLQNSTAEHVTGILQQIFLGGQGTVSTGKSTSITDPSSGNVKSGDPRTNPLSQSKSSKAVSVSPGEERLVTPGTRVFHDEVTNSLIILATPKDYAIIEEVIKQIDIVPRQVLIEVLVAEVRLIDELQYGIEWFLESRYTPGDTPLTGFSVFGDRAPDLEFDASNLLGQSGFTFAAIDAAGVLRGLLQTLASEAKAKVLASPQIMVSDNMEARIQVGDQVPVETGTSVTQGGETVTTIQYRDTGSVLDVKPHINEGGLVTLEVTQELSIVSTETGVKDNPIFSTRTTETHVVVHDGQTLIIGGLIQETGRSSRGGVPILKDIPVLGFLFGSNSSQDDRTELIILITPHVIKSINEASVVTNDFKQKLEGLRDLLETENAGMPPRGGKFEEGKKGEPVPR
jgi:general secretion pathway protein D